uniref:Ring-box 1 n=2 Tax=Equus TaxID=9789 RepID=A0A9L0SLN2_HORSE
MAAAMDVDTPSGTNSGAGKKRFEVKKWNAVALWAWDIVVDNCAICRNHIMDLCMGTRKGEFFHQAQPFCYSFSELPSC